MKFRYSCLVLLLFGTAVVGCRPHIDVETASNTVFRLARTGILDSMLVAGLMAESILEMNPRPRYWSDSLAYEDSLDIAYLYRLRTAHLYHRRDTLLAVLSFIETIPWSNVWGPKAKAQFWREYAEDAGQALMITQSPNMARLTYDAFVQAEHFAKQYEDDPTFYAYVLETKREFHHTLLTMPDSVRMAYGPLQQPTGRSLWLHAIVVAFVVLGGGVSGFHLWRRHKRRQQHAMNPKLA